MKYRISTAIILFSLTGCTQVAKNRIEKNGIEFNIKSAEEVIQVAKDLSFGKEIGENRWVDFFKSNGYKHYLVYSDSAQKKEIIKEAIITVFDNTKQPTLDSLLGKPIRLDKDFYRLSLIQNFYKLKQNLSLAETFLKSTDFKKVLISADSMAQIFLPKSAMDSLPHLYPVFVVVADPDGRVLENSIVIDLNQMLEMGEVGLIKFVAHEFHHNYRKIASREYSNPLMIELNKLHQEALADLIDKEKPPVSKLGLFPESILNAYNSDYSNTPRTLKTLDSLVVSHIKNDTDDTKFKDEVSNFFKFGGHTNGIYMSFMIDETIGKDKLIETYNSPVAFIELYNSVATELESEYVFSPEFLEYIKRLE